MPLQTGNRVLVELRIVIELSRPVRKLWTQVTSVIGRPLDRKMCKRRGCEALSNAPAMSKLRRLATHRGPLFQTVCVCSIRSSRAVRVSRPTRAPIWCYGSRLNDSAMPVMRIATAFSSALPRVSRSAISRYAFAWE